MGGGTAGTPAGTLNQTENSAPCVNFVKPPKELEFNSNMAANWKKWLQQYEWFATASQMSLKSMNIQIATFMSSIGRDAIDVYDSFTFATGEESNLEAIKKKFSEHFAPKVSVTFERFTFNSITQGSAEPFDDFYTKVRN